MKTQGQRFDLGVSIGSSINLNKSYIFPEVFPSFNPIIVKWNFCLNYTNTFQYSFMSIR